MRVPTKPLSSCACASVHSIPLASERRGGLALFPILRPHSKAASKKVSRLHFKCRQISDALCRLFRTFFFWLSSRIPEMFCSSGAPLEEGCDQRQPTDRCNGQPKAATVRWWPRTRPSSSCRLVAPKRRRERKKKVWFTEQPAAWLVALFRAQTTFER